MIDLSVRTQDPTARTDLHAFHADRERFYESEGPRVRIGREVKWVPKEIEALATRAGGRNLFGEPNYRVVWGWSRLTIIAGEWTDSDRHGNILRTVGEYRWEPKNMPFDRWHLETWLPPSHFISKEHWYDITTETFQGQEFAAMGAFPSRGEYEQCWCFENADGSYQELTPHVVETLCLALNWQKTVSRERRRQALLDREEKKLKDEAAEDLAFAEDCQPAFYGQIKVPVTRNLEARKEDE